MAKAALGKGPGWRRHVPPVLLLLAVGTLLVAMARPLAVITLPLAQRTIILAMDVSGSMRATDVQPSRIVAAQEAAKAFVNGLPREVRVGVVAFAGTAAVVQAPTTSREDVIAAIDRFQLQRATATGSGIILSLATIFPDAGIEISQATGQRNMPGPMDEKKDKKEFTPVEPGSYTSAAIIMLTDGARTTGPDPLEAAKMAADRGVRVYTVGIGTVAGETIGFEGWSMRVRLDEATLKQVALLTQAEYFYAGTAARPEEGLPVAEFEAGGREEGDRDHRLLRRRRRAAGAAGRGPVGVVVRPRGLSALQGCRRSSWPSALSVST